MSGVYLYMQECRSVSKKVDIYIHACIHVSRVLGASIA